jgi:hypothetical protein
LLCRERKNGAEYLFLVSANTPVSLSDEKKSAVTPYYATPFTTHEITAKAV